MLGPFWNIFFEKRESTRPARSPKSSNFWIFQQVLKRVLDVRFDFSRWLLDSSFFKCCSDTFGRPPDGFAWLKSCPKCFVLVFGSGWSSFLVICENFFLTAFICYVHVWANLRFWSDAGNSGRWHCSMMGLFTSYSTTSEVMRVTVEDGIVQWWGSLRHI